MSIREAAQAALDAWSKQYLVNKKPLLYEMAALRTALAEPQGEPQGEPVEYQIKILGDRWTHCAKHLYDPNNPATRALYTHPAPLRDLSRETISKLADAHLKYQEKSTETSGVFEFVEAILKAAGEK